jgi:hypothetical protein
MVGIGKYMKTMEWTGWRVFDRKPRCPYVVDRKSVATAAIPLYKQGGWFLFDGKGTPKTLSVAPFSRTGKPGVNPVCGARAARR